MDQALTPTLGSDLMALERRITNLERLRQYRPVAVATVITGGAVRDFGFASLNTTSYADVFRADAYCTAPVLDYDLQISDTYGTSITSIEWQIEATIISDGSFTTLASGTGTGTDQFMGQVDILELMGEEVLNKFLRFDIEIKRTGGSGDAAIRPTRPMLLRAVEI